MEVDSYGILPKNLEVGVTNPHLPKHTLCGG